MTLESKPAGPPPVSGQPSETKNLVPILVIVGVLMCGCLGLPVLGGLGMVFYWASDGGPANHAADMVNGPVLESGFGGGVAFDKAHDSSAFRGADKDAAYQDLLAAEAQLLQARQQYEAAQAVYEQQRDFNAQQAGRLAAQGVRLPPPQPPDPQLQFNLQAAEAQYAAAKAAYDALQ